MQLKKILLIAACLLTACGYTRTGRGINVPFDVRRLAIPVFRNDTAEAGLEATLTDALRRRFLLSRYVELSDVEQADAIVVGVIGKFTAKAISFTRSDFAAEYRASLQARVKIIRPDGAVLWSDREISAVAEYRSTPDISETEANKNAAIKEITTNMARDIHDRIFDGFPE